MGFFKDFKDDFSEATDELFGGAPVEEEAEANDTLEGEIDVADELSKLDGLFEQVSKKMDDGEDLTAVEEETVEEEAPAPAPAYSAPVYEAPKPTVSVFETVNTATATDETSVITNGMTITGDLDTTGSVEVQGKVVGNVRCNGKLVVTGTLTGDSDCSEFFADASKVEGEVKTSGTAKIGAGSVVVGNISAKSAVIAGAVKGDIDVDGPVVVDTSAVIVGNIKSRSVQINNGAVIEGFCSQTYADVDVKNVFA